MTLSVLNFLKQHLKRTAKQTEANICLFQALQKGDLSQVREALDRGADVNAKLGKILERPLEFAIALQFKEGIFLLLDRGAKIREKDVTCFLRASRGRSDFFLDVGLKFIQKGWQMNDSTEQGRQLRILAHFNPVVMDRFREEQKRIGDEKAMLELKQHLETTLPRPLASENKPPKARL